ncbi:MAG: hypothetical protein M3O30_14480 [Planctomycetota bacterium]|nr:hypothetical protein [Planctomycetota bacterium]
MDPLHAKRIVFYNHWNNGDVYLSRPVVEYLMKMLPGREFVYSHACPADLLGDIEGLKYDPAPLVGLWNQPRWIIDEPSSTVFINTWVGLCGTYYVFLPPFGGHCISLVHYVFSEQLRDLFNIEPPDVTQFIPVVNYSKFFIGEVDRFVEKDKRRKVLISNGKVLSKQAENFDFSPIVDRLARNFPDILFIPTAPLSVSRPNVIQSADIIKKGRPDLNETGYLSTFCDVIVGRSSGPYTFSINPQNIYSNKAFVCFCNKGMEANYGLDDPRFGVKCSFFSSSNYNAQAMTEMIERQLKNIAPSKTPEAAEAR